MTWNFKFRNYFVAILAICCLISCEKDEIEPVQQESIFPRLKGAAITSTDLSSNPLAYRRLMDYLQKPVAKSSVGIELDTTFIRFIEADNYISYTFKIKQDSLDRKHVLRNFVLTYVNDTTQIQQLVDYPVLENGSLDMENITSRRLYGDELLNTTIAKCSSGGPSYYQYEYQYCYPVFCDMGGEHGPGEPCTIDGVQRGYTNCVTRWQTVFIDEQPCDSTTLDDGNPSSGGGGGSNTPIDDDDAIIIPANPTDPDYPCPNTSLSDGFSGDCITPSDENDLDAFDPECDYLQDLLDDPVFKSRLNDLISSAQNDNFEKIHEYTVDLEGNQLPFYSDQGTRNVPTAPGRRLANGVLRTIIVHTHYEGDSSNGTISMFSYADLNLFLTDAQKNNIQDMDTSQMTSILAAANATSINVYAIKKGPDSDIANNYPLHQIVNLGMTPEQIENEQDLYKKRVKRADDQSDLEIIALDQFKKMGLQLYKTTGVHTGWEQLTLKPNPSDPDKPELGTPISCN